MASPARKFDDPDAAPRAVDPLNPTPPLSSDPAADPRYRPANDPRLSNATVVESRGMGNGVLIAALVIVLAVIAYFIFAPGTPQTTVPADQPATTTEPAAPAPAAPAPDAAAPAPAPDAAAPAAPAPDATAPAAPADQAPAAPESSTPAEPAPAAPAPAQPAPAPAQ